MAKNTGGPAFPTRGPRIGNVEKGDDCGMTLRDWFAGMALAEVPDPMTPADAPKTAALAYAIADAMIQARTRESETERMNAALTVARTAMQSAINSSLCEPGSSVHRSLEHAIKLMS